MRIGLDASWASSLGTGTASYTEGLVRALVNHREHEYILYFRPGDDRVNPLYDLAGDHVHRRIVGGFGQPGRTLASLTLQISRDHIDVFHSPGFFLPLCRTPRVVTFHDVNMFLQWDKWWRPGMRLPWLSLAAQTIVSSRTARCILADSENAAAQIRRVLRVSQNKTAVLYPGIDDCYFDRHGGSEVPDVVRQNGLSNYILSVGVLSPQKNLDGIVRAFARIDSSDLQLAIAGRVDGPYFETTVRPLIERLGLLDRVRVLGVVPPASMPDLYGRARVFVFPSFAEGFGLPPLEAMACGTPVVASNVSSLPEVLGDAALLVSPTDIAALADAIDRAARDIEVRRVLTARGRARAARFRWSKTADRALALYAAIA